MTPSPTRYNPSLSLKQVQDKVLPCTFKSSVTPRGPFDDLAHTPGPSAYSVNDSMTTPRASRACIGNKQPVSYDNQVPGPGSYDNVMKEYIEMTTPSSPAFTLHGKLEHGGPFDVHAVREYASVGPGTYTLDKLVSNGGLILPHAANLSGRHPDPLERENSLRQARAHISRKALAHRQLRNTIRWGPRDANLEYGLQILPSSHHSLD